MNLEMKKEVIELLRKSLFWEEGFLEKYDDKSIQTLLQTLPEEKYEKIKPLLDENIADTGEHYRLIKEIIEKIESDGNEL